jgi:hypothetical protein
MTGNWPRLTGRLPEHKYVESRLKVIEKSVEAGDAGQPSEGRGSPYHLGDGEVVAVDREGGVQLWQGPYGGRWQPNKVPAAWGDGEGSEAATHSEQGR